MKSYPKKINSLLAYATLIGFLAVAPSQAQVSDPGAAQDVEAAREKLLKASDQLDLIESNSEATKTSVEALKTDLAKVQEDNAALKQQVMALQDALAKAESDREKQRQILLDEVAKMIASDHTSVSKVRAKKKDTTAEIAAVDATSPPEESAAQTAASSSTSDPIPAKPQKGYYHIVESHETLTLISAAYRQQGVNVSVAEIKKANGLTDKDVLKVGQKLFIPKPET